MAYGYQYARGRSRRLGAVVGAGSGSVITLDARLPIPDVFVVNAYNAYPPVFDNEIPGGHFTGWALEIRYASTLPNFNAGTYLSGVGGVYALPDGFSTAINSGISTRLAGVTIAGYRVIDVANNKHGPWGYATHGATNPAFTSSFSDSGPETTVSASGAKNRTLTTPIANPQLRIKGGADASFFTVTGAMRLDFAGADFESLTHPSPIYNVLIDMVDLDTGLASAESNYAFTITNVAEAGPVYLSSTQRQFYVVLSNSDLTFTASVSSAVVKSTEGKAVKFGFEMTTTASAVDTGKKFYVGFCDATLNINPAAQFVFPFPGFDPVNGTMFIIENDVTGVYINNSDGSYTAGQGHAYGAVTYSFYVDPTAGTFDVSRNGVSIRTGLSLDGIATPSVAVCAANDAIGTMNFNNTLAYPRTGYPPMGTV